MGNPVEELRARVPGSIKVKERNRKVLAQEMVSTIKMSAPFFVKSAKGCRVKDVDNNEYIDLAMGFGPLFLGHNPEIVKKAILEAAEDGAHFGLASPYQGDLAELLVEASPSAEKVVFCNSGSEATMYAIRAARAHSKKTKIAQFVGCYHGSHDYVLVRPDRKSGNPDAPGIRSQGAGIPQAVMDTVMMLPYRNKAAFDLIRKNKDELALVMVEPVQSSNPRTDQGEFLKELSQVCKESHVLFLMDEVITGFRLGYGGGQEFFDVRSDLCTYGKTLGGGMPIGAVGGTDEIMGSFNYFAEGSTIFSGGTFSGNPMTMRVGAAVVRYLKANPEIYTKLADETDRLAEAIDSFCKEEDFPVRFYHAQSMCHLIFQTSPVNSAWDLDRSLAAAESEFYTRLHKNGVIIPGIHLFFTSPAHKPEDIDLIIEAFKKTFLEMREAGSFAKPKAAVSS